MKDLIKYIKMYREVLKFLNVIYKVVSVGIIL